VILPDVEWRLASSYALPITTATSMTTLSPHATLAFAWPEQSTGGGGESQSLSDRWRKRDRGRDRRCWQAKPAARRSTRSRRLLSTGDDQ
jgi:hypothetical protein